ncbi:hypothetical protein BGZ98_001145 [Dissophora globulifera]|nr:hypothetical protein BGZ98_001145 [Dissophora globulifera]
MQYGITTTSLEVPEFDSFKLLNGIDDINDHSLSKSTLAAMLDDAINYIRNWLARKSATDIRPDYTALDPLILSCLPSFLIGKSSDSLGDLHRTLSTDGHIKWVCQDHYRAQFTSGPAEALDKFISKHLQGPTHDDIGLVSKKSGYMMISSTSREVAKEFYKHLGVVRQVYNLRFRFAWQATKSDIQLFCDAVQRSNVRLLIVDSSTFATSGRTLRDTSRLRPVMSLMESGKLQNISLGLEFVDNVMGLGGTSIPNLCVLMLELGSFSKSIRVNFSSIPALERLKLDTQDKYVDIRLQAGTIELSGRFHAAQRIIDEIRDITMIRIPFDTDSFASDVSWLDQRYTGRHRALVVEFFGMNNEAIAGVEFRPLDSAAGTSSYGERFRGNNSAMFIRWGDDDSLLSSECIQDSSGMRLDFSALNQDWIQRMLRSFASKHHQGLEIVCSPLPDDQRWLITSGIDTATWNNLTYLVLGGADLDDWATDLARVLNRTSLQHLQRLTITGNKKCLSVETARWIGSMLSSASPLIGLRVISLKDVHLSSRSWFSVISTMDCSSLRTLNFRGSSIQPSHLECLIQGWPLGAPLESLLLHDIGWIGALSRAGRERIRSQLAIKAKQAVVKYY